MDRWEDSATSALTSEDARAAAAANGVAPGAADVRSAGDGDSPARENGWTVEVDEMRGPARAMRAALVVGSASVAALAIAGGVTWFIVRQRRLGAARDMERAIAASRLLRLTPAAARPHVMEATKAVGSATQYAQQTAAETARMARALRRAAGLSASSARDYATERAALAQDTLSGALDTARGGASSAWSTVSQAAPFQRPWLMRVFNAGRYAGRMEQRLK
jgi:hypothetical protein